MRNNLIINNSQWNKIDDIERLKKKFNFHNVGYSEKSIENMNNRNKRVINIEGDKLEMRKFNNKFMEKDNNMNKFPNQDQSSVSNSVYSKQPGNEINNYLTVSNSNNMNNSSQYNKTNVSITQSEKGMEINFNHKTANEAKYDKFLINNNNVNNNVNYNSRNQNANNKNSPYNQKIANNNSSKKYPKINKLNLESITNKGDADITERNTNRVNENDGEQSNVNFGLKEAMNNFSETYNSIIAENIVRDSMLAGSNNDNFNLVINFNNCYISKENNSVSQDNSYYNYNQMKHFSSNKFDLSQTLINDEKNKNNISRISLKSRKEFPCKFINEIKKKSEFILQNQITLNYLKFIRMRDDAFLNLFSFIFDEYDTLKSINKQLRNKVQLCLSKRYSYLVDSFVEHIFKGEDLQLYEYYFSSNIIDYSSQNTNLSRIGGLHNINLNSTFYFDPKNNFTKQNYNSLNLVLKSKILTSRVNQTFSFSLIYKLINNEEELIQTWKIDILEKDEVAIWMASEAEEFDNDILRFCYLQPIFSYCNGDYFEISINLMSTYGQIDIRSVKCSKLRQTPIIPKTIKFYQYEKPVIAHKNGSAIYVDSNYDRLRFCELENIINLWKNVKTLTNNYQVKDIHKIFGRHFEIMAFHYDFSKFYVFKVKMRAINKGLIKRNRYLNFEIEIKPENNNITNRMSCLGLLNYSNRKYEVRVGQIVFFYFTDLYG
jgi:hypothetical protein